MPNLILPSRRISQPQGEVKVSPNFAGTIDYLWNITGPSFTKEIVNGVVNLDVLEGSGYSRGVSKIGTGLSGSGAAQGGAGGLRSTHLIADNYLDRFAQWAVFTVTDLSIVGECAIFRATSDPGSAGLAIELFPSTKVARMMISGPAWTTSADRTTTVEVGVPWLFACDYEGSRVRFYSSPIGPKKLDSLGDLGTGGGVNFSPLRMHVGGMWFSGQRSFPGVIHQVGIRKGLMTDEGLLDAIIENPWQVFAPQKRVIYFDVGAGGGITLSGNNSTQTNTSGTGGIAQTHVLTSADCAQANASSTGSVSADSSVNLTGTDCAQSNASDTGSISQTHILDSANCAQNSTSSTGGTAQTHVLTGANCTQSDTCSVGIISTNGTIDLTGAGSTQQNTCTGSNISQTHTLTGGDCAQSNTSSTEEMLQTHALTGADCTQNNASSVAAIIAAGTINLIGANATQSNASDIAAIGQTHVLAGANSVQSNTSSAGALLDDSLESWSERLLFTLPIATMAQFNLVDNRQDAQTLAIKRTETFTLGL